MASKPRPQWSGLFLVVLKATAQRKGAQPLRVVGRQKRVFARVPGGKPARTDHIIG